MKQCNVISGLLLLSALAPCTSGRTVQAQTSLRDSAFAIANAGRSLDAQPLFERLIVSTPNDVVAHERFGLLLFTNASALPDAEARRLQRVRARAMLEKALKLGSTNRGARRVACRVRCIGAGQPESDTQKDGR
ncbi:MAG: hypothetical protein ACO1Q7_18845 [Gemmatimonas sp.]